MLTGLLAVGMLAGCTQQQQDSAEPQGAAGSSVPPTSSAAPELPPAPEPGEQADCPYLERSAVAKANGQRVSQVRISAEQPPSCFFYALTGKIQLTVRVYTGEPAVAEGLVDQAAPIDSSNPAKQPAGWEGGYLATEEGAVYAVAKGGNAVIVSTNQQQSVKARTVAEEAITAMGF
ncbi:DUF2020 domain-containing protein [Amycolatopsis aidingensis]|uniref:DUF2020 domain-containing protein n=1 Tax=Amycolatopsis aidingensis TaxID=2842453 RepID=UPI0038CC0274